MGQLSELWSHIPCHRLAKLEYDLWMGGLRVVSAHSRDLSGGVRHTRVYDGRATGERRDRRVYYIYTVSGMLIVGPKFSSSFCQSKWKNSSDTPSP